MSISGVPASVRVDLSRATSVAASVSMRLSVALGLGQRLARRRGAVAGGARAALGGDGLFLGRLGGGSRRASTASRRSPSAASTASCCRRARSSSAATPASSLALAVEPPLGLDHGCARTGLRRAVMSATLLGQLGERRLAVGQRRLARSAGASAAVAWRSAMAALAASSSFSSSSSRTQDRLVVGDHPLLAGDVVAELGQPAGRDRRGAR